MYPEYRSELKQVATKKHYTELWMDRDMYHLKRLTPYHVSDLSAQRIFQNKTLWASHPVQTDRGLHLQWTNAFHSEGVLKSGTVFFHTCGNTILPHLTGIEKVRWFGDQYVGLRYHTNQYQLCGGKEIPAVITPTFHSYSESVCMVTYKEEPCVVYEWYPLQLCKLKNNHLVLSTTLYTTPEWFGGLKASNGVRWKDQQWVILSRTYVYKKKGGIYMKAYPMLVVLDDDFKVRYSEFFRIGEIPIVSDLQVTEEGLAIGYTESGGRCYISKYTWEEVNGLRWTLYDPE